MIALRFYRIYDIGREIDLNWLEQALAKNYFTARTSFVRVKPKSIMIEEPPLMIQMNPIRVERDVRQFEFSVAARVYDIGVISFCFIYENPDADLAALEELAFLFARPGRTHGLLCPVPSRPSGRSYAPTSRTLQSTRTSTKITPYM